ncbi:MAG: zinc ABC transporter substrate-binding protein [Candidatus Rokubacteria bacterium]|nr:zinc ABC transporter substrate-binding protein [Candidatus Rokubacteria bacterium]MBI3107131.1 zinc ABC transporter substrate-binding protein [Candidatus Rokubacteria bacterium]
MALALLALGVAGCSEPPTPPSKPLVVATFYPLYEFSRQVTGDRAEVVSLVPPGVEPHDWEPTPQEVARVGRAGLLVYNGAGIEPWVDKLLADAAARPATVNATEGLPLLTGAGGGPPDPHVWLDPVLAQAMVERIMEALKRADPAGAGEYAERARAFQSRLARLHEAYETGLARCARRDIVVSHAAFGYLGARYRLSVVPVMGLAPESEPSPAQLAAIVRFARQRKVKYIFFETLVSPRLAETLAREVGARTLVLNPVEGLTPEQASAGQGYVALMEENLKNLRVALECP